MVGRRVAIIVVGMPGSGKSTFSAIARELGIQVINLGDMVREEVARRGLEQNLENLLRIAKQLREILGNDAIMKLAAPRIREALTTHCIVVVDGVRSLDELEYLRGIIDAEIIVLAVYAPPKLRFQRLVCRGRPGDPRTWEEFKKRDLEELSWGLGNVVALADMVIVNEGSYEEFISSVKTVLSKVYTQWCI
ncbi:MAG: AAA family ATPase [Ignisphaera sp.]|nr:AAA family ATPase [Ignisphaera sp.]MCX8167954.1 AAA family ATPase [Ignisphaera sp.]MDW8085551.1 AAA family ATPase [Ignisphaera sp.]